MNKKLSIIFLPLLLCYVGVLEADNIRGRIVKIQGHVYIVNEHNEKRSPDKSSFLVNENETILTEENSRAVVQFNDGALSVLNEKSALRVERAGWFSQLSGKVYYIFKKVFKKQPKKVHTKFATIGIRGTTFIVEVNENRNMVALKEGGLNIESPDDVYEIRKQKKDQSFSEYKNEYEEQFDAMNKEYLDYKNKIAKQFLEYKKSFGLEPNHLVSFSGKKVEELTFTPDIVKEFDDFSSFASDYESAYRELDELE